MHAVIQPRMQTISMIGSCRELQWNMQIISTTASSAADYQCATTRTNSLHPPPPKIKSTGGSTHWRRKYKTRSIRRTKSDWPTTRIRCDHNKQSKATWSTFARLCSSVGVLTLFFRCLFIVSRKRFTVTLCTATIEMLQAQFLLSQFSSE